MQQFCGGYLPASRRYLYLHRINGRDDRLDRHGVHWYGQKTALSHLEYASSFFAPRATS